MLDQKTYRHLPAHDLLNRLNLGNFGAELLLHTDDLFLWLNRDHSVIFTSRPLSATLERAGGEQSLGLISEWISLSGPESWSRALPALSAPSGINTPSLNYIGAHTGSCLKSISGPVNSKRSIDMGATLALEVYKISSRSPNTQELVDELVDERGDEPQWLIIMREAQRDEHSKRDRAAISERGDEPVDERGDELSLRSQVERLTARVHELQHSNSKLAKNAQAKDEFLASMSHELRTPLNSIMGLCEALLEGVYGTLDRDQHQPIRQVFSNGHHLLSVISDILDLSKLRAGGISLSLTDIDVEACCFEAIQVFRIEMQRKHLTINISVEGIYLLNADERWFKQVLMNLISNAVKFTPSRRKIGITVGESPEVGYLRVTVWDEGIGMREEDIPRLFQTFVQLDTSLARAYEGTGLGLSIVSSVMQLHNGKVSVESELNGGSKFHLDFPWVEERGHIMDEDLTPTPDEVKSILLVEDSEVDADRVRRFLDELDAEVFWDQRGADAVSLAYHHVPDVIILDLFLPEQSGWEILSRLKGMATLARIPVVVCSVLERDTQRPEMRFVDAYLQKPFSRQALRRAIRTALSSAKHERDHDQGEAQLKRALMISAQEDSKRREVTSHRDEPLPSHSTSSTSHESHGRSGTDEPIRPLLVEGALSDRSAGTVGSSAGRASAGGSSADESSAESSADPSAPANAKSEGPPQILVVDDNLSNIQLVQDYLRRKGYLILTAEDGYQAVQIARAHQPDLILMDIQMPHMDGIEATGHIKSDPRVREIPIFALTALAMPGDRERCLKAGMSDYFTKPVSLRGLYKKIKETLGA